MMWRFLLLLLLMVCQNGSADELKPVYIQLDQLDQLNWVLRWKASANSSLGRLGEVVLPESCVAGERVREFHNGNVYHELTLSCETDLSREEIGMEHLASSVTDALVRVSRLNETPITLRLTTAEPVATIPAGSSNAPVISTYTYLGIEHILMGFDHLLFVLALVLLLKGGWLITKTVTAFTIAHSVTLVGTTLGYFALPSKPVEAVIALSIVFLAAEILKTKPGRERLSEQYPWLVAFLFGLLHGFGFAGALAEIGLPQEEAPLALLTFNIGVEIGQLLFVFAALAVLKLIDVLRSNLVRPIKRATAYGIGSLATYWLIDRMI